MDIQASHHIACPNLYERSHPQSSPKESQSRPSVPGWVIAFANPSLTPSLTPPFTQACGTCDGDLDEQALTTPEHSAHAIEPMRGEDMVLRSCWWRN